MAVHLRFVLIALILQASPSTLLASDANGWFEEDCSGFTFHITGTGHGPTGQDLVLRLGDFLAPLPIEEFLIADWLKVPGKRCSGVGECEDAIQARIWLDKEKGRIKRISGRYSVDFAGQHLEGPFVLKYRKHRPPLICE